MQVTPETPTAKRTIAGVEVQVPQPYAEGHVVTAAEASMLNQTIAENFSNNLRDKIGKFIEAEGASPRQATAEEAQAIVDAYTTAYTPGVRQGGGGGGARTLSPLEKEVRVLARGKADELLRSKNMKKADVKYDELVAKIIERSRDQLEKAAQKVLDAKSKAAAASESDYEDLLAA